MPHTDPLTITEVTLGEVYRLMKDQGETLTGIGNAVAQRPTWADITRMEEARLERSKLHAEREKLQDQAIKDLQDGNRWVVRTVGTALVTALAGLITAIGGVLTSR